MAKIILVIFIMLSFHTIAAQQNNSKDTLKLDMDFDNKIDTVVFDRIKAIIVCKLSSQNFKIIKSNELAFEEYQSGINETGNGFTYSVPWMRAGYHMDFAYNKIVKKIQLVAMDRYEFGPANNDGSGESNVNLITNDYEGNWNYYDLELSELIKIPTIKRKMVFPKTFLEDFSDKIAYGYAEKCAAIFNAEKTRMIKSSTLKKYNYTWSNYYPFANKNFLVSIKKTEEIANSEIYYLEKKGSATKLIWKDKILINQPKISVAYQDFNGDDIKDLLVFSTSGARGNNEYYYLYLVNPKTNSLTKVKDFEKIVNPTYNKKHKVIIAYGYSGTNNYSIYKILPNHKAVQIGSSFEDNFDGNPVQLNQKIEKILKKN